MDEAISVCEVSVSYGNFIAVTSASFTVSAGECVAIVGPNGHGKSSLAKSLVGMLGRKGEVTLFGRRLRPGDSAAAVKNGLVLVPEGRHLFPEMTVRENILLGGYLGTRRLRASRAWDDASPVIEFFPELRDRLDQRAGTLSGGQQQMVALARAMAGRPRVLILDEPCLGLAEAVSRRVYEWLALIVKTDVVVILIEENPQNAIQISNRVLSMYKGVLEDTQAGAGTKAR